MLFNFTVIMEGYKSSIGFGSPISQSDDVLSVVVVDGKYIEVDGKRIKVE